MDYLVLYKTPDGDRRQYKSSLASSQWDAVSKALANLKEEGNVLG